MAKRNEAPFLRPIVLAERSIDSGLNCFIPLQKELGLIHATEEIVLRQVLDYFVEKSRQPDLIIYLRCDPVVALDRIKRRDRQEEKSLSENYPYIEKLHQHHEEWLMAGNQVNSPKVVVFDNNLDRSDDDIEAYQNLANYIKSFIGLY
jgi:deoxyadenosine/deoxycytidine kinase